MGPACAVFAAAGINVTAAADATSAASLFIAILQKGGSERLSGTRRG
jgi:hypothetical protein